MRVNRVAVLGASIVSLSLVFLPLIELKPNRLASGIPFTLFQFDGGLGAVALFALALLPFLVAMRPPGVVRGALLAVVGNALLVMTLDIPAVVGTALLGDAAALLGDGVRLSNPRILPSAALALGLFGAYTVLYGGLRDLSLAGTSRAARGLAAWGGVAVVVLAALFGRYDVYSLVVEFHARGQQLAQRAVEHVMFVAVALVIGLVLGVGLGLWAHRDRRASPVILYLVGIIQTVPSLALFGVLLVPLARFGDQRATDVALALLASLVLAGTALALYRTIGQRLRGASRQALLVLVSVVAAVPVTLVTVIVASFAFRVGLLAFTSPNATLANLRPLMLGVLVVALVLHLLARRQRPDGVRSAFARGAWVGWGALAVTMIATLVTASQLFLARVDSLASLSVRDLGVSGIGPAPAVIALTLYSLLPLVRNTYAGLTNVDPAVIDSGRGMGMNAAQRFMQIELPLALPVIMAGVRNASVALVGIAAIATVIGAGGLGDFILGGIINTSIDQILLGAIPAVLLAVVLDAALRATEHLLVSPGIRASGEAAPS